MTTADSSPSVSPKGIFSNAYLWMFICMAITLVVMAPNLNNDFVNWDDYDYIMENELVHELSMTNIKSAFTTLEVNGAYHPLTHISWALDDAVSDGAAWSFHFTNVLLHLINTGLVFWLVLLLGGKTEAAIIVTLLFGIHPMHLEAVAWISSRKDVLYAFFFLFSLVYYLRYLDQEQRKSKLHFSLCLFFFICALLSKPMAMTLPVILLLIDYYKERKGLLRILVEKAPFFIISIVFGLIAVAAQQEGMAMEEIKTINFGETLFVGAYGSVEYLLKAIFPFHLSSFHPYPIAPGSGVPWYYYASIPVILALAFFAWRFRNKSRVILFGLGFFLVSIAPVSQVLPFGEAVTAERFVYVGYFGLFFVFAAGLIYLVKRTDRIAVWGAFTAYVLILSYMTFQRSDVWENGNTMWTDVIEKYPDDYFGYATRGRYWFRAANLDSAMYNYELAISKKPDYADGYSNKGFVFLNRGQYDSAIVSLNKAISLDMNHVQAHYNRAKTYEALGKYEAARYDYLIVYEKSGFGMVDANEFAVAFFTCGDNLQAKSFGLASIAGGEATAITYYVVGSAYLADRELTEAETYLTTAISMDPDYMDAYINRGLIFMNTQRYQEAEADFTYIIKAHPEHVLAISNRALLYETIGKIDLAIADCERLLEIRPDHPDIAAIQTELDRLRAKLQE